MEYCALLFLFLLSIVPQVLACGLSHHIRLPPVLLPPPASHRLLKDQPPHPIKIKGEFISIKDSNNTLSLVTRVFNIAAHYYSRVITTTKTPLTQLPDNALSACNVSLAMVPPMYLTQGFNSSVTDLVIFVKLLEEEASFYAALATRCVSVRRPIYGYMNINSREFQQATYSNFQLALQLIIHEMTHVLGFGLTFFDVFYTSPTSEELVPIEKVLKTLNGRTYVITPNVLEFVKKYFNCDDNITGALLQSSGQNSSALNHWQHKVYYNELMTSSVYPTGMKISSLTLALLKDTNYYADVDLDMAEPTQWGYHQGCQFAQGVSLSNMEFCNKSVDSSSGCDFYSDSISYCSDFQSISNNFSFFFPYSNGVCSQKVSNLSTPFKSTPSNYFLKYGTSSKCFRIFSPSNNSASSMSSVCYEAECVANRSIKVTVGSLSNICIYSGQKLRFGDITLYCPSNIYAFCLKDKCKDQCNQKGMCLKGECHCIPLYHGKSCEIKCSQYYDTQTNCCVDKCRPQQFVSGRNCEPACPVGLQELSLETRKAWMSHCRSVSLQAIPSLRSYPIRKL